MTNMSKKALRLAAVVLAGATVLMTGCGPTNLDDANYMADSTEISNDAADKVDAPAKPEMMEEEETPKAPEAAMPPKDAPAAATVVAPTEVVQLPGAVVRLPSEYRAEAPIVTATGEQRNYARNILAIKNIHVSQPAIENHLITKNVHTHRQFQTNIINHPSFRRNIGFAHTASASEEVLPTTVTTTATTVYGGVVAGPVFAGRPFCAPWYSGGMLRACGGLGYGGFGFGGRLSRWF